MTPLIDTKRFENLWNADLRLSKDVRRNLISAQLHADLFNLLNAYAAENITFTTGTTFQLPTTILGPRTARIGLRFVW